MIKKEDSWGESGTQTFQSSIPTQGGETTTIMATVARPRVRAFSLPQLVYRPDRPNAICLSSFARTLTAQGETQAAAVKKHGRLFLSPLRLPLLSLSSHLRNRLAPRTPIEVVPREEEEKKTKTKATGLIPGVLSELEEFGSFH